MSWRASRFCKLRATSDGLPATSGFTDFMELRMDRAGVMIPKAMVCQFAYERILHRTSKLIGDFVFKFRKGFMIPKTMFSSLLVNEIFWNEPGTDSRLAYQFLHCVEILQQVASSLQ